MDINIIKWRQVAIHLQIDPNHIYELAKGMEHKITEEKLKEIKDYISDVSEIVSFMNKAIENAITNKTA